MKDLTLVEEFLNTLDERSFTVHGEKHVPSDQLTSVEALGAWLATHGLAPSALTPSDVATALDLRTALRTTIRGDGENQALAAFPLRLAPGDGGLRMRADTGVPGLDAIVETVATGVAAGDFKRLSCAPRTTAAGPSTTPPAAAAGAGAT